VETVIITVTIQDADEELYERVLNVLSAAGVGDFYIGLQTREQYAADHPDKSA
jgi:hypothetical protein